MTYTFIPVVFFPLTVFKVGHIRYNRMRKLAIWIVVLLWVMIFVGSLHVPKQWDWSMIHILNLFLITDLKWVNCLVNEIMHIFRRTHFRQNRVINHGVCSQWNFNDSTIFHFLFRWHDFLNHIFFHLARQI